MTDPQFMEAVSVKEEASDVSQTDSVQVDAPIDSESAIQTADTDWNGQVDVDIDGEVTSDIAGDLARDESFDISEIVEQEIEGDSADASSDVTESASDEEDPIAAFRTRLESQFGDWYVVHSYAGFENRVKQNLETRTTSLNMEDYIYEISVPQEEVTEIKNGVRKLVKRNKFPGYVLVRMDLTDESWGVVRHTPGVTEIGRAHV